jgi:hypothetical protein
MSKNDDNICFKRASTTALELKIPVPDISILPFSSSLYLLIHLCVFLRLILLMKEIIITNSLSDFSDFNPDSPVGKCSGPMLYCTYLITPLS